MGSYWRRLRLITFASDMLAVLVAYLLAAGWLLGVGQLTPGGAAWPRYPALSLGVAALTLILGWQFGTYRRWALLGGHRVYPLLATVATYGVVIVIVLSYAFNPSPYLSRTWLVESWLGSLGLLSVGRILVRWLALHWRQRGYLVRRLLIAGANQQGVAVAQQLNDRKRHGIEVLGFLDDYERPGTEVVTGLRVVGHPGAVLECAASLRADEVVIISNGLTWESQRLLAELVTRPDSPIEARISATFYDLLTTSADLSHVAYVPMLTLHRTRISGVNAAVKRLLDRGVSLVLLTLLLPVLLYWRFKAWVLHVPMLKRDRVLGLGGRVFSLVGLNPSLTRSPVAARWVSLWNVLRQEMSLVGPRPIPETARTSHERWLANLFAMQPGLTGLWRIRGGEFSLEQSVALDLYYVRNYSLTMDGQILLNTVRSLVKRSLGGKDELARWESPDVPVERREAARQKGPETEPVVARVSEPRDEGVDLPTPALGRGPGPRVARG